MTHLVLSLRVVSNLLKPILLHSSKEILSQLGLTEETDSPIHNLTFKKDLKGITVVEKGTPIFPRLDVDEEVKAIQESM
ncbi:methionine--tRNA ligase, partial [Salmonella enterica subsp. enterica serovar Enteritidis]